MEASLIGANHKANMGLSTKSSGAAGSRDHVLSDFATNAPARVVACSNDGREDNILVRCVYSTKKLLSLLFSLIKTLMHSHQWVDTFAKLIYSSSMAYLVDKNSLVW